MLRIQQENTENDHQQAQFVPLKAVNIESVIRSFAADVSITQVFRNDEKTPIEAVYCFPIEEKAAVYSFVARIDNREIVSQLREKKEAQKEYIEALQQNHGAFLLEQDEKSQDIFIINIGALETNQECTITISYVTELELVHGSIIQFVVPTTIAPRYNADKGDISSPANTNSLYVQSIPYTIGFRCHIEKIGNTSQQQIARVNSTSHPIEINVSQNDVYEITFAQQNNHLNRDILINIELAEKHANTIIAVEHGAVMVAFTPTEEDCYHHTLKNDQTNEFIFVIDCSGSMNDENKIGLARQAMLVFLKSLPVHCHFNIIRFGSNYKCLFNEVTVLYNEANVQQAEQLISQMQADLGGTELVSILSYFYFKFYFVYEYSYNRCNGSIKFCLIKIVFVRFSFLLTVRFQMFLTFSICADRWPRLLVSFHLDWVIHPVDLSSKVLRDRRTADLYSFHRIKVSIFKWVNNCNRHSSHALPMFTLIGILESMCKVLQQNYLPFTPMID